MKKKIIFLFLVVILLAGGFFYYWQSQKDVRALNKTLPKGVKVEKSLFGNSYKVVNKIDGYEFEVPKVWEGVEEIEYVPKEVVAGMETVGLGVTGRVGMARVLSIDIYFVSQSGFTLSQKAQEIWDFFGFPETLKKNVIGEIQVFEAKEDTYLGGTYVYFFQGKDNKIYVVNNGSEEFIKEVILSGKW